MHPEAQNLVAACSNCLSLVVGFHGHTSCIRPPRARKIHRKRARIAAQLGERPAAVELLRAALTQGKPYDLTLHTDRALEPLRGYEPFDHLVLPGD